MNVKRPLIVILSCMFLIACVPTPDDPIVVQKDTDRLVDTVTNQSSQSQEAEPYRIEPITERFQYNHVSNDEHLHIHVDADVQVPESGTIPMLRVKATGFSEAFAKQAFDLTYQGNPVYLRGDPGMKTKRQFAEEIAYYQELIDTGRTAEEEMDEQGALEQIEWLKEMYEQAPLEAAEPENILSDGTMQIKDSSGEFGNEKRYQLEIYDDIGYLNVLRDERKDGTILYSTFHYIKGPIDNALGYMESRDGREFQNWFDNATHYIVASDDTECAYGQTLSPKEAVKIGLDYFSGLGLSEIAPFCSCDLYIASTNNGIKPLYVIDYVKLIDGCQTAFVPLFQAHQGYAEHEMPWKYETIRTFIDEDGVLSATWSDPIEVIKEISDNVEVISYEAAKNLFEVLCKTIYEPRTQIDNQYYYIDLDVNHMELSLIRIREQNADQKVGLYVPAWIFYGTEYFGTQPPENIDKNGYLNSIIFAINAVDGSVIDISKGY